MCNYQDPNQVPYFWEKGEGYSKEGRKSLKRVCGWKVSFCFDPRGLDARCEDLYLFPDQTVPNRPLDNEAEIVQAHRKDSSKIEGDFLSWVGPKLEQLAYQFFVEMHGESRPYQEWLEKRRADWDETFEREYRQRDHSVIPVSEVDARTVFLKKHFSNLKVGTDDV